MNMIVSTCNREGISCQKTNLQFDEVYRIQHEGKLIKDAQYRRKLWLWKIKGRIALTFPEWESYRYCKNNMKRINADYDKVLKCQKMALIGHGFGLEHFFLLVFYEFRITESASSNNYS